MLICRPFDPRGEAPITEADNGSGVPPAVKEHLFTAVPSTKAAGMGIGLSVCRTIVEQHGGKIWHHEMDGRTSYSFTVEAGPTGDEACSEEPSIGVPASVLG